MAPATVYLETTVLSYLTARDVRDEIIAAHQRVTRTWWESQRQKYRVVASAVVVREASAGDPEMAVTRLALIADCDLLQITDAVDVLAALLLAKAASSIFSLGICGILRERLPVAGSSTSFADWGMNHRPFARRRS